MVLDLDIFLIFTKFDFVHIVHAREIFSIAFLLEETWDFIMVG